MSSKPRFKPWSTEIQIPNTDCTIQVGDVSGKWAVVVRKIMKDGKKKAIALKRIQKLTDTQIVNVIKDTIGHEYALDTFTLGSTMSKILREVYDKIKNVDKTKQEKLAAPKPTQVVKQATPTKKVEIPHIPRQRKADSFWSLYDSVSTPRPTTPQITNTDSTQVPSPQTPTYPETQYSASEYSSLNYEPSQQYINEQSYQQYNIKQTPPIQPQPAPAYQPPPEPPISYINTPPATQEQEFEESDDLSEILSDLGLTCPYCGSEIDPDTEVCPKCGKKIPL